MPRDEPDVWFVKLSSTSNCRASSFHVTRRRRRAQRQARSATRSVRRRLHVPVTAGKFAPQARAASAGGFTNHRSVLQGCAAGFSGHCSPRKVAPQASKTGFLSRFNASVVAARARLRRRLCKRRSNRSSARTSVADVLVSCHKVGASPSARCPRPRACAAGLREPSNRLRASRRRLDPTDVRAACLRRRDVAPRCFRPRHATTRRATSRHATPRRATPRHATPRRVTPLWAGRARESGAIGFLRFAPPEIGGVAGGGRRSCHD